MSVMAALGDAIAAELNAPARSWAGTFTAVRANRPRLNREDAATLHVFVVPKRKVTSAVARSIRQDLCEFAIGIQKGLTTENNSESDALILLGEQIQEYFDQGVKLANYNACCEKTSFGADAETPLMSTQDYEGLSLYTGVVSVMFRVLR